MNCIKKVVWSVDAFEQTGPIRRHTMELLRSLVKKTGAEIVPVYVLTPAELNLSIEFTPPWIAHYRPAAEAALRTMVEEMDIPHLKEPVVLVQSASSTKSAVKRLSGYAKRIHADAIVVGTHARKGMARLLLGSFAESLMLHSEVPVLVSGPAQRDLKIFDKILFPTDLGDQTTQAFRYALALAKQLKAGLSIFHAVPNPVEPILQSGMFLLGGNWVPVHTYFAQDLENRHQRLEQMVRAARHVGVKADYYLHEASGSIAEAINHYAERERYGLITMAAQSGPWSAALVGSITRQVVRGSHCPVWILHGRDVRRMRASPPSAAVKPLPIPLRPAGIKRAA